MNVSFTLLQQWKRCRYRFYLSIIQGYVLPPGLGQIKGTAGHIALAKWYSSLKQADDYEKTANDCIKHAWNYFSSEGTPEQFVVLEEALWRYFSYSWRHDRLWDVIATEYYFDVPIGKHKLIGYIDGIVRINGQVWLLEHKFLQRIQTSHLGIDPQITLYMLAAHYSGFEPIGVIYNCVRIGGQNEAVVRNYQYRNKGGLAVKAKEIEQQADEIEQFMNYGGNVYRNETANCTWDCAFFDVCLSITDSGSDEGMLEKFRKGKNGTEREDNSEI